MRKIDEKISEIKLMSAMKDLKEAGNDVSDDIVMSFIYDVHSLMSQYRERFNEEKTEKTTMEDFDNAADSIIELAYTIILGGISRFELPLNQMKNMKEKFLKTMISDNKVVNEAFAWNFTILMLNNFRNNQKTIKTSSKDN